MGNQEPQTIGMVLSKLIKSLGFERKLLETNAVTIWKETVGGSIAEKSEALKITDGKLLVRVPDPTWKQQMIYLKKELIAKLNARLGKAVVKDIFFV